MFNNTISRLEDFVAEAFRLVGLDWREHVESDPTLRPTDLKIGRSNPDKARGQLSWIASSKMRDVVRQMGEAAQNEINIYG